MNYYPEPSYTRNNIKVELDLSNYATKSEVKKATGVDISEFAKKVDLAGLKLNFDELDKDKLKTVALDLGKLSNVLKYVVKNITYDELVKILMLLFQTTKS